ncbi:MAG: MEDS domain-containing protein [Actinobacteria bacterium]|nr:MEDS domain-containing protein [Actinomycetota bacterium]
MPPTPATYEPGTEPHQHLVGFYETEAYLAGAVARFLLPAFEDDAVAVVIATPAHHELFRAELVERGLRAADVYVALDAADTLAAFTDADGRLDPDRFRTVMGAVVERHRRPGRSLLAYGEMVVLLWEAGDVKGALQLEQLWNDLADTHRFTLLCGYPTTAFADDTDTEAFRAVCDAHGAVLPPERFSSLQDPDERQRAVAVLQQEAVAGANEREALRRKQQELEAALERLTEVDRVRRQFVAMVVHDIRNPTVVISGLLDFLREAWPELDQQEVSEYLTTASRNASKIQRLLDDVLLMSRIESGQFEYEIAAVDLPRTVREAADDVRAATGRAIEVAVPSRLGPALADEGRQAQIVGNLLSNAVKFSAADTTITVTLADLGDRLAVHVRDEGPGIAAADVDKLFRPFSRLPRRDRAQTPGTGLGLFITKALVEGQGGSISVESQPGRGTTFTYTVPAASSSSATLD